MADLSEQQLGEEQAKFEAEQLAAVDALEAANPDIVDLDLAENIGLITEETRDKIRAKIPNHELLFQRALAMEHRAGNDESAFRRAFSSVYGKFLFEQQTEYITNPQSNFVMILSRALSNRIEAPDNTVDTAERGSLIALRSELESVAKRLHMLDISSHVNVDASASGDETGMKEFLGHRISAKMEKFKSDANKKIADLQSRKTELESDQRQASSNKTDFERQLAIARKELQEAEKTCEDDDLMSARENLSRSATERDSVLARIADVDRDINKLRIDLVSYSDTIPVRLDSKLKELDSAESTHLKALSDTDDRIQDLEKQIDELTKSVSQTSDSPLTAEIIMDMSDDDIESLKKKDKVVFARTLFDFKSTTVITANAVVKRNTSLRARFNPGDYSESDGALKKAERVHTLIAEAFQILIDAIAAGNSGPISDSAERLKFLRSDLRTAKGNKADLQAKNPVEILGASGIFKELADLAAHVNDLGRTINDESLKRICGEYLTAYENSIVSRLNEGNLSKNDLIAFHEDRIKILFSSIIGRVNELIGELNKLRNSQNLDSLNSDVSSNEELIEALNERRKSEISKRDHFSSEVAGLEAKIGDSNDRLKGLGVQISDVTTEIASQRALLNQKPSDWVLGRAFPGVKIEGNIVRIRGFETNFKHVTQVLSAAKGYFESPEYVPKVRYLYQDLVNLTGKTGDQSAALDQSPLDALMKKAGLDPAKSVNSQLPKLRQQIQSKKDQKLSKPSSTDIRKGVEAKQRAHQQNPELRSTPFDEARASKEVTEAYIKSMAGVNDSLDEEISDLDQIRETLEEIIQKAKEFHERMTKFVNHLEVAAKAGVEVKETGGSEIDILVARFRKISLKSADFKIDDLMAIYHDLDGYFESDTNVSNFAEGIRKAQQEIAKSTNLGDAAAAKKILGVLISEQNPDISFTDQQKLASMILADDVATIQSEASYEDLAKRGSAELLDTVRQAGFKRRLIGFQYKEGDKDVQPFRGLKPEEFNDWPNIEKLFKIGRLNHQNGFFALAAFRNFDGDLPSIQTVKLEKRLRQALAGELGVEERMDEAGIDKIVNKAFNDQLKKADELVKSYFQHFDRNKGEWDENKVRELNLRYKKLKEERRSRKITAKTFDKRMAELVLEAKESEVIDRVDYSQDNVMAGYWYSHQAQWIRDRGYDVGKFFGKKGLSLGMSALKLGGYGLLGTAKLGLSAVTQTALLPLRAAKYPLMVAAKPLIGAINLFRRQKWTPLPTVRDTVKSDAARAAGYFQAKGGETLKGTGEKLTAVPKAEWGKVQYQGQKYVDRSRVRIDDLQAEAEELKKKGDPTPVEVAGSPFIDLEKYKKEIAKLDKILTDKPAEERPEDTKEAA